jgi:hypothetical protein
MTDEKILTKEEWIEHKKDVTETITQCVTIYQNLMFLRKKYSDLVFKDEEFNKRQATASKELYDSTMTLDKWLKTLDGKIANAGLDIVSNDVLFNDALEYQDITIYMLNKTMSAISQGGVVLNEYKEKIENLQKEQ